MIKIKKSETADTRTCDVSTVTKETLEKSSRQHVFDVVAGMMFFQNRIMSAAFSHDMDKFTEINQFYADFTTGFKQTTWWDNHRKLNRHHLNIDDGVPEDVNLVDVIEHIVDCVMAGMGRSGSVYPLSLKAEVLERAFQNTVELLKQNVEVSE